MPLRHAQRELEELTPDEMAAYWGAVAPGMGSYQILSDCPLLAAPPQLMPSIANFAADLLINEELKRKGHTLPEGANE